MIKYNISEYIIEYIGTVKTRSEGIWSKRIYKLIVIEPSIIKKIYIQKENLRGGELESWVQKKF